MKKILLIATLWTMSLAVISQERAINFDPGTFAEALAKAKQENKLLFIDCYTSWCGPCKMLAKNVFTNNEVADYFNGHFVSLKVDCEKGEGPEIKKRFGVSGYPTLLFIDGNGNLVNKFTGASEPKAFLKKVREGLDPKTSLYGKIKRYEAGERDLDFVLDLIRTFKNTNEREKATDVSKELLASLPESQWLSKEMWDVISYYFISPYGSEKWNFILNHADEYIQLVGADAVSKKIGETLHPNLLGYACAARKATDTKFFDSAEKIIESYHPAMQETLKNFIELGRSAGFDDFKGYFKTVKKVLPRLDLSEHFRFWANALGYLLAHANDAQKKELRTLLQVSYDKSNEYMQEAYKPYFKKFEK